MIAIWDYFRIFAAETISYEKDIIVCRFNGFHKCSGTAQRLSS